MKLSEIKGEQALDVLADILEPAARIISDDEIEKAYRSGQKLKAVKIAIKNHKRDVIAILAIMDGEDPETYEPNVLSVPIKLLEILNDPDVMGLFLSQEQSTEEISSIPATENTGDLEA